MRELISTIEKWITEGKPFAIATVVKVYGSAPRGLGSKMAINQDGLMVGSVSGGCVEGAVISEAIDCIKSKQSHLVSYGISNEQAIEIGLACGGKIEVFINPVEIEVLREIERNLGKDILFAEVIVLTGKQVGESAVIYPNGETGKTTLPKSVIDELSAISPDLFGKLQKKRFKQLIGTEEVELFFNIYLPYPKLIVIGAVHIAIPLVQFAKSLGFHTIVVDPRKAFSNRERFPDVDELIIEWPQEYLARNVLDEGSYLVTLSHDDKFDIPALMIACSSKVGYIGALGSKKTFERRKTEILEMGASKDSIARIHSPVGLNIGAHTPEEIALSILAEIVAVRNGIK